MTARAHSSSAIEIDILIPYLHYIRFQHPKRVIFDEAKSRDKKEKK